MHPKTLQKKNSFELQSKNQLINNSYLFPNNTSIQPNIQHQYLKNSQGSINKKTTQSPQSHPDNRQNPSHINKMLLIKTYVQQQIQLKSSKNSSNTSYKQKQYRDVVISQQFVKSHKLYKMLKEQMAVAESRFHRQTNILNNILEEEDNALKGIKNNNHQIKVEMWELKNQLMELKSLYDEEQEENKRLVEEYQYANRYQEQGEGSNQNQNQALEQEGNNQEYRVQQCEENGQEKKLSQMQQKAVQTSKQNVENLS